jgi:hypothetical protein
VSTIDPVPFARPSVPTPMSATALANRCDAAADAVTVAQEELLHWTLRSAYALIRNTFPAAAQISVDASGTRVPEHGRVVMVLDHDGHPLYQRDHLAPEAQDPMREINQKFEKAMAVITSTNMLPRDNWSLEGDPWSDGCFYTIALCELPGAVEVDKGQPNRFGFYPEPTGLAGVVFNALDMWMPHFREAAYLYARALTEGRCHPVTTEDWAIVPESLGYEVNHDLWYVEASELDGESYQTAIASLKGLADGVIERIDDNAMLGEEDPQRMRVAVEERALTEAGMTLADLATAFGGDVVAVAVAAMQALCNFSHPDSKHVVPCQRCRVPVLRCIAHPDSGGYVCDRCHRR